MQIFFIFFFSLGGMAHNNQHDDEEEEENVAARQLIRLEKKAMDYIDHSPQVVSFVPFRGAVVWSWKRTFAMSDEELPTTFRGAFDNIVTARDEVFLFFFFFFFFLCSRVTCFRDI